MKCSFFLFAHSFSKMFLSTSVERFLFFFSMGSCALWFETVWLWTVPVNSFVPFSSADSGTEDFSFLRSSYKTCETWLIDPTLGFLAKEKWRSTFSVVLAAVPGICLKWKNIKCICVWVFIQWIINTGGHCGKGSAGLLVFLTNIGLFMSKLIVNEMSWKLLYQMQWVNTNYL